MKTQVAAESQAVVSWISQPALWEQEVWHHHSDIQECGNVRLPVHAAAAKPDERGPEISVGCQIPIITVEPHIPKPLPLKEDCEFNAKCKERMISEIVNLCLFGQNDKFSNTIIHRSSWNSWIVLVFFLSM